MNYFSYKVFELSQCNINLVFINLTKYKPQTKVPNLYNTFTQFNLVGKYQQIFVVTKSTIKITESNIIKHH